MNHAQLTRISLVYEVGEEEYAFATGYLMPDRPFAFFVSVENTLWFAKVTDSGRNGLYVESAEACALILATELTGDPAAIIPAVYDRLRQMDGLTFLTDVLAPMGEDITFQLSGD